MSRQPVAARRPAHGDRTSAGSKASAPVVALAGVGRVSARCRAGARALEAQRAPVVERALVKAQEPEPQRERGLAPASRANEACRGLVSRPGDVDGARVALWAREAQVPRSQREEVLPARKPRQVLVSRPALQLRPVLQRLRDRFFNRDRFFDCHRLFDGHRLFDCDRRGICLGEYRFDRCVEGNFFDVRVVSGPRRVRRYLRLAGRFGFRGRLQFTGLFSFCCRQLDAVSGRKLVHRLRVRFIRRDKVRVVASPPQTPFRFQACTSPRVSHRLRLAHGGCCVCKLLLRDRIQRKLVRHGFGGILVAPACRRR